MKTLTTATTRVFMSNRSQAVRLPKAVAFPEGVKDVVVIAAGNRRVVVPAGESWDDWFDAPQVSDDFMVDRDQPQEQERDPI